jgi:hypothetical protein
MRWMTSLIGSARLLYRVSFTKPNKIIARGRKYEKIIPKSPALDIIDRPNQHGMFPVVRRARRGSDIRPDCDRPSATPAVTPTAVGTPDIIDSCLLGSWTMDVYALNNKFLDLTGSPTMYVTAPSAMMMEYRDDTSYALRERFNSHVASIFSMRRELAIYTILSLDKVVCS